MDNQVVVQQEALKYPRGDGADGEMVETKKEPIISPSRDIIKYIGNHFSGGI